MAKPNPAGIRKFMERAVQVMRTSVAEHRDDDTPSPQVGAVLVRPDGTTVEACRGELRDGDHAEFTLLERKCRDERLDECILFATLEPCLDRNLPKRGCARHIVNARIKTVYVGVEDTNPTVAGKGMEYLRRHGVTVEMFHRDLQEEILKENERFFDWAASQAQRSEPKPIKLSPLEDALPTVEWSDLDPEALRRYQERAGLGVSVDDEEFRRRMTLSGLLVDTGEGSFHPSGFGWLLFGKSPRDVYPQAGLLARAEFASGSSTRKTFDRPLALIPGELERWLDPLLPRLLDLSRMERQERTAVPFQMIREAVVNALVHRDYSIEGQKCQLTLSDDVITVSSPGGPIPPVTLEQMQSFQPPIKSRNPILHHAFAKMGLAEEQGFGLQSLKAEAERVGLPRPRFTLEDGVLVLRIFLSPKGVTSTLDPELREKLSDAEFEAWQWAGQQETFSATDYAQHISVSPRTSSRHLRALVAYGLLERTGSGRATAYRVSQSSS